MKNVSQKTENVVAMIIASAIVAGGAAILVEAFMLLVAYPQFTELLQKWSPGMTGAALMFAGFWHIFKVAFIPFLLLSGGILLNEQLEKQP